MSDDERELENISEEEEEKDSQISNVEEGDGDVDQD